MKQLTRVVSRETGSKKKKEKPRFGGTLLRVSIPISARAKEVEASQDKTWDFSSIGLRVANMTLA